MTNDEWLIHFREAYKLPFNDDIRSNNWQYLGFSENEKNFLLSNYSKEFINSNLEHILKIVDIFTRYFFKKAEGGFIFCPLDAVNKEFGKTLSQNYNISDGPFYDLAKTYWTFRLQLDEDSSNLPKGYLPLYIKILRQVEINIAGLFFPTGGHINKGQQKQVLKEYAPDIDIDQFMDDNPMFKSNRIGIFIFLLIATLFIIVVFAFAKWIFS